jgi:aminoglycoside phosphotransferase (APT) family kinase protein
MAEPERLAGGMVNAGHVVRIGDTVVRPAGPHTDATSALLRRLAPTGFEAPEPIGIDDHGKARFRWIDGEVPTPPFPSWSLTEAVLASVGRLLRRYHETLRSVSLPTGLAWSDELADPVGGPLICHNDVCPENVVFRDGHAVALLDFDFAAPGRPLWDLAQAARMWIPLRPPAFSGDGAHLDPLTRLKVLTDAYGLAAAEHREFVEAIVESRRAGSRFVRRRVEAGSRHSSTRGSAVAGLQATRRYSGGSRRIDLCSSPPLGPAAENQLRGCLRASPLILSARRRLGQQDPTQRIETSRRKDGEHD